MVSVDQLAALRAAVVRELDLLQTQLPRDPVYRTRGSDSVFDVADATLQSRVAELRSFLDLFDRSSELRQLLSDLMGQAILATEQRLLGKLEAQEQDAIARQRALDRGQRVENILLSALSLFIGWLLSIIGTPLTLLARFFHYH